VWSRRPKWVRWGDVCWVSVLVAASTSLIYGGGDPGGNRDPAFFLGNALTLELVVLAWWPQPKSLHGVTDGASRGHGAAPRILQQLAHLGSR